MDLIISKLLPVFVYPVGLTAALLVLTLLLLLAGRRKIAPVALLLGLLCLYVPSMPVISENLVRSLEMDLPARSVHKSPSAGAIVVLSGGVATTRPVSLSARPEQTFDRLYQGYRLYQAGKAPLIVLSGGSISWRTKDGARPESVLMADILRSMGIPAARILVESKSRNTRENAVLTAKLLRQKGIETILLATSALHMPRALACFRGTGLQVHPAPADYLTEVTEKRNILDYLPDAGALDDSTAVIKEYLGLLYYSLRGWI